jgi:hypothetical protein
LVHLKNLSLKEKLLLKLRYPDLYNPNLDVDGEPVDERIVTRNVSVKKIKSNGTACTMKYECYEKLGKIGTILFHHSFVIDVEKERTMAKREIISIMMLTGSLMSLVDT